MYVLTIDQAKSRTDVDRVPRLLGMLGGVATLAPFERTVGDEVQGVPATARATLDAVLLTLREGHWHIGLGIGGGTLGTGAPAPARTGRGEAFLAAREAVEASKGETISLAVRTPGPGGGDLEALLRLFGVLAARRTRTQWAVIDALVEEGTGIGAADLLGVSPQAVSKSLLTSAWREEVAALPLAVRLLEEAAR